MNYDEKEVGRIERDHHEREEEPITRLGWFKKWTEK